VVYCLLSHRLEGLRLFEECQSIIKQKGIEVGIGAKEGCVPMDPIFILHVRCAPTTHRFDACTRAIRFAEIVQRHQGRYEMRYGMDGPLFGLPALLNNPLLTEVRAYTYRRPAEASYPHNDGPTGIPLVEWLLD
jgi:hypothetical protein